MKVYKDFPKQGVDFIDINPVLNDYKQLTTLKDNLKESVLEFDIDKVVAIESRGFIFGTELANLHEAGLVLARKQGKLPGNCWSKSYGTEYSQDRLEMQIGSIKPGDKVLIHDDVLATGGTAKAVKFLVEKLGGIVVCFSFIVEIESLKGSEQLVGSHVRSLIKR